MSETAVSRYYQLLDSGTAKADNGCYAGAVAANTVAMEFGISTADLWQWISIRATIRLSPFVQQLHDPITLT